MRTLTKCDLGGAWQTHRRLVSKMTSALLTDCRLATFALQPGGVSEMALVDDGTLVISGETIAWAGPRSALPGQWKHLLPQSCEGGLLTAGLVDAFTGLHPGPAEGVSDDLYVAQALAQLAENLAEGVTWREFKIGAHANLDGALRRLSLAHRIRAGALQRLSITLRAAHQREGDQNLNAPIEMLCTKLFPVAHALGLLDAVEVLCDDKVDDQTGAAFGFSFDDANRVLEAAYRNKIPTRMGCERHADTGGVALAPLFYARCAAYLNFCDKLGIEALAQARTTAMLLPLAQVPGQRRPPVDELRSHRIPIALGTAGADDDADSSATGHAAVRASPLLAARRACELYGLTAAQAVAGITFAGSQVLAGPGADPRAGTLDRGAPADLALWDAADPEALLQTEPPPLARRVWIGGRRWI